MKIRLFTSIPRTVFWAFIAVFIVVLAAIESALLLVDHKNSHSEFNNQTIKVVESISRRLKDNEVVLQSFTAFRQLGDMKDRQVIKTYIKKILHHYPHIALVYSVGAMKTPLISSSGVNRYALRSYHSGSQSNLSKSNLLKDLSMYYEQALKLPAAIVSKVYTIEGKQYYAVVQAFNVESGDRVEKELGIVIVDIERLISPLHTTGTASLDLQIKIGQTNIDFSSVHRDRRKRLVSWGSRLMPQLKYSSQFAVSSQPFTITLTRAGRMVLPSRDLMLAVSLVLLSVAIFVLYVLDLRYRSRESRLLARDKLHKMRERSEVTLDSIDDAVVVTDNKGEVEYINPIVETMLDIGRDSLKGKTLRQLLVFMRVDPESIDPDTQSLDGMSGASSQNDVYVKANIDLIKMSQAADGVELLPDNLLLNVKHRNPIPVSGSISPIKHSDKSIHGYVVVFRDVGEARELAKQLEYRATHDDLTGLYNRREFETRLQTAIDQVQSSNAPSVLMFLDLDQFKIVNDTCGHITGDLLLKKIARVLNDNIRSSDWLARLGGDEFGVLLEDCNIEDAKVRAEKLNEAVKNFRFKHDQKVFDIAVSLGLVEITSEPHSLSEWMTRADSACYLAKDQGRNRYHVYSEDDDEMMQRRGEMEWLQRIKQAYEDDRFELYIQEIVPIRHGVDESTRHFEVLLRMLGDDDKVILPMAYIMAAERYDKMYELDQWVVRNAFRLADEAIKVRSAEKMAFAINLSGQSLSDSATVEYVAKQLDQYPGLSKHIIFEITETAAISNFGQARKFVEKFRKRGVRFSLDDFGSGMSSFAYLKNLPVDYIKIDGQFIKDLCEDKFANAVVYSINNFGHSIGVKIIAEYVESEQIKNRLFQIDVDYGQGIWLSKPHSMSDLLTLDNEESRESTQHD